MTLQRYDILFIVYKMLSHSSECYKSYVNDDFTLWVVIYSLPYRIDANHSFCPNKIKCWTLLGYCHSESCEFYLEYTSTTCMRCLADNDLYGNKKYITFDNCHSVTWASSHKLIKFQPLGLNRVCVCVCTGVYSSQAKINKLEMRHSHKNNTAINLRRPEKACASITGNSNNINDNSTHEKKN